jgi:glyoxylase-like metal-dependent hydrolase (beta-lactamase superfamily II)
VLVAGFPAGAFAANCYVIATAPGEQCVIVDPGQDAEPGIEEILAAHRLSPAAVLLTHGHIDHVWSVAPVCGAKGIPAYIHPADRALLSDPTKGFSLGTGQELFGGMKFTEPDDVKELTDGMVLKLVGLEIIVNHAPGHTEGSVAFRLPLGTSGADEPITAQGKSKIDEPGDVLFSGDLLFAGSIGRTDLPGGDYDTILRSLARVCLTLPDETVVLSGHGPQTTIGRERRANPFLAGLEPPEAPGADAPGVPPADGPHRGL